METIQLKMTSQETQFIFAILAKSEINEIDSLTNLMTCVELLENVAKEYEKEAQEIVNKIRSIDQERKTIAGFQTEEWTDEKKKQEFEKLDQEIMNLQEEFSEMGKVEQIFEIDKKSAIYFNAFLSEYIKEGTKFGGNKEMREMLSIPGLKILQKVMIQFSSIIEGLLKDLLSDNIEDENIDENKSTPFEEDDFDIRDLPC